MAIRQKDFFAGAIKTRQQLTQAQLKNISNMYKNLAEEIRKETERLSIRTNVSSVMKEKYLKDLSKQMDVEIEHISKQLNTSTKKAMTAAAQAVVDDNVKMLSTLGLSGIAGAYSYVPRDVVELISSGQLYKGKWTLSNAIWGNSQKTMHDIDSVVSAGIAAQKSTFDIAKDLEKYVDPSAVKGWDWAKVYPGTNKVVDYNAQRLARTMISHSYEESFVKTTKDNPLILGYRWLTSNHDSVCEICLDRATDTHGVIIDGIDAPGVYEKDALPLDHPNGECTFSIVSGSMLEMSNTLADWVNGKSTKSFDKKMATYAHSMRVPIGRLKMSTQVFKSYTSDTEQEFLSLYSSQIASYTKDEKAAMRLWAGSSNEAETYDYEKINNYLRGRTDSISGTREKAIASLDSAIKNFEVKEGFIAVRGVDMDSFEEIISGVSQDSTAVKKALEGVKFLDKGFMSTSYNTWGGFPRDAKMYINIPKGRNIGCVLQEVVDRKGEEEFLLKRGTKLLIDSVKFDKNTERYELYCSIS